MWQKVKRVTLACTPTPLMQLDSLSSELGGPSIWIKRDDLTGLATGGNKARKLEYLVADALDQGTTTLITTGAAQSNHARQTAAAAARYGLRCTLVLGGMAPRRRNGNLLLDDLLGAHLRWAGDRDPYALMQEVAAEERAAGRAPYIIPAGGSNAIGAVGYVRAAEELAHQMRDRNLRIDHIVLPVGSAGTQAGLVAGARAYNLGARILGISVGGEAEALRATIVNLAMLTVAYLGLRFEIDPGHVQVNDAYIGAGYGVLGNGEREAIRLLARTEGLLLDPVYTGRAMAGLIDLIARGTFSKRETVLFWHTGGTAGLYAYAEQLMSHRV